jgi:hypothetical protein
MNTNYNTNLKNKICRYFSKVGLMIFITISLNFSFLLADTLIWQDESINKIQTFTFLKANKYCKNLTLYDSKDWHLPSREEFNEVFRKQEILEKKFGNIIRKITLKKKFNYINKMGDYWSSDTTWRNFGLWAYFLQIKTYTYFYGNKNQKKNFRCVRNSVF